MRDHTALPQLPSKLHELTGQAAPGYRRLYNLALDGAIPTTLTNGRYYVRDSDLPVIAERLGLSISQTAA